MDDDASPDVPATSSPELFALAYDEIKRLARFERRRSRPGATLDTTALVHETYLKIERHVAARGMSREHLTALAARAMRQILVDHARRRATDKRAGDVQALSLGALDVGGDAAAFDLVVVDRALTHLDALDPRLARLVELHVFGGLGMAEIGTVLGLSERSVFREWRKARAFLVQHLDAGDGA